MIGEGTADGEFMAFREARPSIAGPQHVFICRNAVMAVIDTCGACSRNQKPQDLGIHVGTEYVYRRMDDSFSVRFVAS